VPIAIAKAFCHCAEYFGFGFSGCRGASTGGTALPVKWEKSFGGFRGACKTPGVGRAAGEAGTGANRRTGLPKEPSAAPVTAGGRGVTTAVPVTTGGRAGGAALRPRPANSAKVRRGGGVAVAEDADAVIGQMGDGNATGRGRRPVRARAAMARKLCIIN
jgi:hypothetical protein